MDPSEVEEDDQEVLLIWDLEVQAAMSASATALPPKCHLPDKVPRAPLLDLKSTSCNCSSFPNVQSVIVNKDGLPAADTNNQDLDTSSDDDDDDGDDYGDDREEEDEEEEEREEEEEADKQGEQGVQPNSSSSEEDTTLFTEFISLKGSSYHKHFQGVLKSCKARLCMKNTPSIRLHRQPANIRDENAIVVQVLLEEWHPTGYIPGKKVPKVTMAMNDNKITEEKLKNVLYQYVPAVNDHRYFAHILLTKQGKWGKDKEDYMYNEKI